MLDVLVKGSNGWALARFGYIGSANMGCSGLLPVGSGGADDIAEVDKLV